MRRPTILLAIALSVMTLASCGQGDATESSSQRADGSPAQRSVPVNTITFVDATLVLPVGWKAVELPPEQQAAASALVGPGGQVALFSTGDDPPVHRAVTVGDLPFLILGRLSLEEGQRKYSADPIEYRGQMAKLQDDLEQLTGRRQAPVRETTLGGTPAVAHDLDRIVFPMSDDVEARQLNVSTVHKGRRYAILLFERLDGDHDQARELLDGIRASWRWK